MQQQSESVERREWNTVDLFSLTMAYTPTLTKWKVGSNLIHHHIVCSTKFAESDELRLKDYPILYDEANSRQMPALALHCCNNCTCHISIGRDKNLCRIKIRWLASYFHAPRCGDEGRVHRHIGKPITHTNRAAKQPSRA